MNIPDTDPRAIALIPAIKAGDLATVRELLTAHPELVTACFTGQAQMTGGPGDGRTVLHLVTDWPGHFPNGPAMVRLLVELGADVNAPFQGSHTERPLHWAASSDDLPVLDALLEAGADLEAAGAMIDGGSALSDAVAFAQWHCARRLIACGARANLWQAAALGLVDVLNAQLSADPPPAALEITNAFWSACHGGQLATAKILLAQGADPHWVGHNDLTPLQAAERSKAGEELLEWLRCRLDGTSPGPGKV